MECPVCVESIIDTMPLSCGHWICRTCIVKSGKNKCPLCRQNVTISTQEYLYIKYLIRSRK